MNKFLFFLSITFIALFTSCGKDDYEPDPPQTYDPSEEEVDNNVLDFLNEHNLEYPNYDDFEKIFSLYEYGNQKLLLTKVKDETLWLGKFDAKGKLIYSTEWKFSDENFPILSCPSTIEIYPVSNGKYVITDFFMSGKLLFAIPYSKNVGNIVSRNSSDDTSVKYCFCGLDWETGAKVWDGTECPYINPYGMGGYISKNFCDYTLVAPALRQVEHIYCLKYDGTLLWHRDAAEGEFPDKITIDLSEYDDAWFINDTEIVWYTYYGDNYSRGLRIVNLRDYELVNSIYLRPYNSAGVLMGDYDGPNNTCGDVINVAFKDNLLLVDFDFYESYYKFNDATGGSNYVKNMLGQYRLTMSYPDGEIISKEKIKDY